MHETQVVERISHMALIADHEAAEVTEPGEEALNLPAAPIPTERTPILRLGAHPSPALRRDHLHPERGQCPIERVRIIRPVADEALRQVSYEAGVERGRDERGRDERDLVRRSRGGPDDTHGERKTRAYRQIHGAIQAGVQQPAFRDRWQPHRSALVSLPVPPGARCAKEYHRVLQHPQSALNRWRARIVGSDTGEKARNGALQR